MNARTLSVVECVADLPRAEGLVVAASVEVEQHLELRARPARVPSDYCPEARQAELGHQNYARVERFTRDLGEILARHPVFAALGEGARGRLHYFWWKILFDAVLLRLEAAGRILEDERPARVVVFDTGTDRIDDDLAFVSESIWAQVIRLQAQRLGVPVQTERSAGVVHGVPRRAGWSRWVPSHPRAYLRALRLAQREEVRHVGGSRDASVLMMSTIPDVVAVASRFARDTGRPLAVWTPTDMDQPYLLRSGRAQRLLPGRPPENRRSESVFAWARVSVAPSIRRHFEYAGLDWFPLVAPRVRHYVATVLPRAEARSRQASRLAATAPPAVVLTANLMDASNEAAIAMLRWAGVPVVAHQHGMNGLCRNAMSAFAYLAHCDAMLCYGEGVVDGLSSLVEAPPILVPTGSRRIRTLPRAGPDERRHLLRQLGLDPSRPAVMYVPASLMWNRRYINGSNRDDIAYGRVQRAVLTVLGQSGVQTIIKVASARECGEADFPSLTFIRAKGWKNFTVVGNRDLAEVLAAGDAFIHDITSTALFCSLSTRAPVFLFDDVQALYPEAEACLRADTFLFRDLEEFTRQLQAFLTREPPWHVERTGVTLARYATGPPSLDPGELLGRLVRGAGAPGRMPFETPVAMSGHRRAAT